MGLNYKGSGYSDSLAVMKLTRPNSYGAITVEVKRNGKQLILKAAGLPEGIGYGLILAE